MAETAAERAPGKHEEDAHEAKADPHSEPGPARREKFLPVTRSALGEPASILGAIIDCISTNLSSSKGDI